MTIDRISNMLSTIKNAAMAKKAEVEFYHTNQCETIAKLLKDKGFLAEVKTYKPSGKSFKMLKLGLAHENNLYRITHLKIVSKPGRRTYKKAGELHKIAAGAGIQVVSTPRGIMSGDEAKKRKLGGELICEVY